MKITFLGTGTSHGIPIVGCDCKVCRSTNKKNKRTRPSALITLENGQNILIDAAPELRLQCLENGIRRVDAVLFTHSHSDHVGGIDDLRRFNEITQQPLHCYGADFAVKDIKRRFRYIFIKTAKGGGKPRLKMHVIKRPFKLLGEKIIPIEVFHGNVKILGFRIRDFAYLTDCSFIPPAAYAQLEGIDTLVLNALRPFPHPTHFSLPEALDEIRKIAPRRAYLTHICHNLEHSELCRTLVPGILPAHDGLRLGCR